MPPLPDIEDMIKDVAQSCNVTRARIKARALTRAYNDALSGTGLRSTEYAVLIAVGSLKDGRMHEVAEGLDMDLSTLSRSVAGLEKKELLATQVEGHRTRRVVLTEAGRAKVAEGYPAWQRAQEKSGEYTT